MARIVVVGTGVVALGTAMLRDKTRELGSGWRGEPALGPTREKILELVSAP